MTFLEAAIEILRNVDGAMHFSEVARLAVEQNLLSHVGRDPEAAMRSCLNSAVRKGRNGEEPIIMREKPGHYGIRPGATLPEPPPRPDAEEKASDSEEKKPASKANSSRRKAAKKTSRRSKAAPKEAPAEAAAPDPADDDGGSQPAPSLEFEAPTDAGLDGVTDVALVMANAVSRLVEERPELRDQLDTMQQGQDEGPEDSTPRGDPGSGPRGAHRVRDGGEERGGRRRRRRRRRGKRVEWSGGAGPRMAQSSTQALLDQVAKVLLDAGSRSLHVRQIAETLANQNVLGGEISEIERAVTAALLLDVRMRGRASRFAARGDARYQLQGTRLPEAVAKAEVALREGARTLEKETATQLLAWLQSLGARALESLVRIYLEREGYTLVSALPPSRGVGKLVVEDPDGDEDGRVLCVVVPRKTGIDTKNWEGEADRNGCGGHLFFCMGDADDLDGRTIGAAELAEWMSRQRIGVQSLTLEVPVLDPTFIESVAGLDT